MIEIGDKVTHAVHGVGTVINTYNNGSICAVDFKGVTKRIETVNLQKGANIYTGKSQAEQLKEVLVEIQKRQQMYIKEREELEEMISLPHNQLIRLRCLKEFINELEAILTGKKLEV